MCPLEGRHEGGAVPNESVFGYKFFEHSVERYIKVFTQVILSVVDLTADLEDLFVAYLRQGTDHP